MITSLGCGRMFEAAPRHAEVLAMAARRADQTPDAPALSYHPQNPLDESGILEQAARTRPG